MKKIYLFVIVILFGITKLGFSQKLDSLWQVYDNKTLQDTVRLKTLQIIAERYKNNNPDTAIILSENIIKLAAKTDVKKTKLFTSIAFNLIGRCYINKGDYTQASEYILKALEICKEIENKSGIGYCYTNMANIYGIQSNYPKALEFSLKALQLLEEIGDKNGAANCYNNIGNIYADQFNYDKALTYYLKALHVRENISNKKGIASSYANLGSLYINMAAAGSNKMTYHKALDYFLRAIVLKEEIGDKQGIGNCYGNIGSIYLATSDYKKALEYFSKSLSIRQQIGDNQGINSCYISFSDLYNKYEDYKKSILYCDSTLTIAKEIGNIANERLAYQNLAEANNKLGNYKQAYENEVLFKQLTDSIFNTDNSKQLGDLKTQFEVDKKEAELKVKAEAEKAINNEEKKRQQFTIYAVAGVLLIVFIFSVFLFRRFKITQKQKHIIGLQKDEVLRQKHIVEEHQREIIDSITYAKRLQQAILPSNDEIKKYLPDTFIYYKPKDIVAGDFYWMEHLDNLTFMAAADSTGHGVPGAMVSVVCSNALNRALKEFGLRDTGKILDKTRELVLETFEKSGENIKDGMDISLIRIETSTLNLQWSGANNALLYIANNELTEVKADKQPIGQTDNPKPFTTHILQLERGDIIYLMTDGYPDQFGGDKGKKYKYKQLEVNLLTNSHKSLIEQKDLLARSFETWKGNLEQVDDVTIIGIKL
ncbi:MAG: tetratricopeptide repeat protein [Bacteroidia bacterium]